MKNNQLDVDAATGSSMSNIKPSEKTLQQILTKNKKMHSTNTFLLE